MLLTRPCKRLDAGIRNLKLRFWRFTPYAWTLRTLRGRYAGKRCFIVGNGPSLRVEDLDCLADEYSFGFNRIYRIFDQTAWRPTFYCSEDEKILSGCLVEVNQLDLAYKFIPYTLALWYGLEVRGATYFLLNQREIIPDSNHFSRSAMTGFNWGNTGAYTAMQIAVYMGFSELYLLGLDHSFATSINNKGETIVDENAKDYFDESYNADMDNLYIPNPEQSTLAYMAARAYADQHGIKILNATRGGQLEVFDRVPFDSLFTQ